jgi:hypothetical protein
MRVFDFKVPSIRVFRKLGASSGEHVRVRVSRVLRCAQFEAPHLATAPSALCGASLRTAGSSVKVSQFPVGF